MFGKPPFSYTDPPNLGDKRDPNYDGNAPTFGYNYPPHVPIHPGRWNDTEHAWIPFPGQHCCPDEQSECLCITSADTSKWDSVYNTVSSNSAGWGGDVAINSADWQSTFYTVSANSAVWNSANELLDLTSLSARWESAYNAVVACNDLIETYSGQNKLYTKDPITGNGTQENPITLREDVLTKIKESYSLVHELIYQLYGNITNTIKPELQLWVSKDDLEPFDRRLDGLETSAAAFENQVYKLWDAIRHLSGAGDISNIIDIKINKKWDEIKKYIDRQDNSIKIELTKNINNVKTEVTQNIKNVSAALKLRDDDLERKIREASGSLYNKIDYTSAYLYDHFDSISGNLINYTNNVSSYLYNIDKKTSAYIDKTSAALYKIDQVTSANIVELIKNTSGNLYQIDQSTSANIVELIKNTSGNVVNILENNSAYLYNTIVNTSGILNKRLERSATYLYETIDANSAKLYDLIILGDQGLQNEIDEISAYIKDNEQKWLEPIYTYVAENEMTTNNYSQYKTAGVIYFNEN